MEPAKDRASFVRDPRARWIATRTSLIWCASGALAGVAAWGRPSARDVEETVALFDGLQSLEGPVDVVMDAGAVDGVDGDALAVLLAWARDRLGELRARIGRRVGVIPEGQHGLVLAGLSPVLGWMQDVSIAASGGDALDVLGAPLSLRDEIERLVRATRGSSALLVELRAYLRRNAGNAEVQSAARALGVSTRSLQRVLAAEGSSFRVERLDARFEAATQLLVTTDEKIASIARKLGITERALLELVRERTGLTPASYRERERTART